MPEKINSHETTLLEVFFMHKDDMSPEFIDYDVSFDDGKFPLPRTEYMVLLLKTDDQVWTTMRRWTPRKEQYYCDLRGKSVDIVLTQQQ